jgi:hypothetical protein
MGNRRHNPRRAKIHRNYSVEDIARLYSVHKNTVRNWVREGLKPIDDQRPTLVRGEEIQRFLSDKRASSKNTCGPGRLYCLPCRAPKTPAGNFAECVVEGDTSGVLQGICPDCDRMIYRRVNPEKLDAVRGGLDITVTQPLSRLRGTENLNVNCDVSIGANP